MTFAASKCVHNLPQTSILLGKLIGTEEAKKKNSAAPQGLPRPLHAVSPDNSLNNYLTTHPGTLFHTLVPANPTNRTKGSVGDGESDKKTKVT